jgi:arylsulfatase A-like enzyme
MLQQSRDPAGLQIKGMCKDNEARPSQHDSNARSGCARDDWHATRAGGTVAERTTELSPSCYGNSILKTPHMDRFGNEGMRFNQAFVTNSLCAPSRASFLTGLYSHSHGVTTNGEEQLPKNIPEAVVKTQMSIAEMDFSSRGVPHDLPPAQRKHANLQALVKNYRTLHGVDENVGRVLDFLDREKLAENTVVIYTSDNGFLLGEFGLFDKRLMYEPSIKILMLMRWPAGIEPKQVDDVHMVLNVDVAPTLLDIASAAIPNDLQGRSWMPVLENRSAEWRDAFLYEFYEYPAVHCVRKHRGVRAKNWKLVHFWEQPEEYALYDLANDPDELVNLAQRPEHTQRMKQLKTRLRQLRDEMDDRDPPGYVAPSVRPGKCPA